MAAAVAARFARKFPHLVRAGSTPRTPGSPWSALHSVRSGFGLLNGYEASVDQEDPDKWTRDDYVELFKRDYAQTSTLRPLKTILQESRLKAAIGGVPDPGHLTPENTPKIAALNTQRSLHSSGSTKTAAAAAARPVVHQARRASCKSFGRRFKWKGYSAFGYWVRNLLRRLER